MFKQSFSVTNFLRVTGYRDPRPGEIVATFCNEKRNHLPPKQRRNFCSRQLQLFVLPLHSARVPQFLSLSPFFFAFFPSLSSSGAIVRIYHPCATFSLLRIECREPAASHPTPSFWLTSANPRNAWDGKDRGWSRKARSKRVGKRRFEKTREGRWLGSQRSDTT